MSLYRSGCTARPNILSESAPAKAAVPEVLLSHPFTVNVGGEKMALTINAQKPH